MNLTKKAMFGVFVGLFIFIAISFGETAGISVFSSGLLGFGGFILLLFMAPLELIVDTYE